MPEPATSPPVIITPAAAAQEAMVADTERLETEYAVIPPADEPATTGRVILRRSIEDLCWDNLGCGSWG